ncbi:M56 family metallopeptidase [Leifsonia shinshuensis]|uniref:M56 family metallopeptidase n=1 Tax=Leifsonia shinshuensis TaxID=150026 RepID=UPI002863B262|nr:M56 family metallopeptidase [Leifsonia shinshuensis]MDR6970439.1 Zn-dependent protease with chaperone function [Leifsonia shinshuensis]
MSTDPAAPLAGAIFLGALAVALAWPVPLLLARAKWPSAAPTLALALWQSIALAGGISMIGSLLLAGLEPFGDDLWSRIGGAWASLFHGPLPPEVSLLNAFLLSAAVLLTAHLVLNLALTSVRSRNQRHRHMELLRLLSSPLPDVPSTRVIDHPAPAAYCLPGARSVTVLSEGMIELLSPAELDAVVAHERAHLRQKHHLLLDAFRSWKRSLPWFPIATRAQDAVALLIEMLADDTARRTSGDAVLAEAIRLVDATGPAGAALGAPKDRRTPEQRRAALVAREERLTDGRRTVGPLLRAAVVVATVLLVVVPPLVILLS